MPDPDPALRDGHDRRPALRRVNGQIAREKIDASVSYDSVNASTAQRLGSAALIYAPATQLFSGAARCRQEKAATFARLPHILMLHHTRVPFLLVS